jgi:hypothetical protein
MTRLHDTAQQRLIDALREAGQLVKDNGHRAMAQCPAHDDNTPSLSIRDNDGHVLIYCHAGCETAAVLDAIGWSLRDLYDNHQDVIYRYSDGRQTVRTVDKRFFQRGNTKGRALYGADRLTDGDRVVFIVEGEKDVHTAAGENVAAVSPAMGAGKAARADWTPLRGRTVVVVADQDGPGRKHAREVAEIVSEVAAAVWIAEPAAGCKDLTDHVMAGHPVTSEAMKTTPYTRRAAADTTDTTDTDGGDDDGHLVNVRNWPDLHDDALQGVAGQIVNAVMPYTEADTPAVLLTLLATTGAMFGGSPYALAANDQHPVRIWPLIVGSTSSGAKGTSWSAIRPIIATADPNFLPGHQIGGIVSGEGLIEQVQDPKPGDGDDGIEAQADKETDKRLLVLETEFGGVLAKGARHGSSLLPVMRQAWDGGRLQSSARKDNALSATDPHIVVIGHITPGELTAKISDGEMSGGTVNRYLLARSRRSKMLPDGGNLPEDVIDDCARLLKSAVEAAKSAPVLIARDEDAAELWRREYPQLVGDRPDGRYADATARAAAQVLRLSVVYAVLDQAPAIEEAHLRAALAVWNYCDGSAAGLFATDEQDELRGDLSKAFEFIEQQPGGQCSRKELSVDCFARHKTAKELDAIVATLTRLGRIAQESIETSGRPRIVYKARTMGTKRTKGMTSGNGTSLSSHGANLANKGRQEPAAQTLSSHSSLSSQGSADQDAIEVERYSNGICIRCGKRPRLSDAARCADCASATQPDAFGADAPF